MALIVYPLIGYDAFGTEAEISAYVASHIGNKDWLALTTEQREVLIRQATQIIFSCPKIKLPEDTTEDLKIASAFTAINNMLNDVTEYSVNEALIIREKIGSLSVSYSDKKKRNSNMLIVPMAQSYLAKYGCTPNKGGFSQTHAGRS